MVIIPSSSWTVVDALITIGMSSRHNPPIIMTRMIRPTRSKSFLLFMGLYDTPLPPRPNRKKNEDYDDEMDENEDSSEQQQQQQQQQQRLFQFNRQGKEERNLLPPLSRTLESGIDCYFETSDRLVQNLIQKTDCHPDDAAWALEACKGDLREAWTRISMARRMILDGTSTIGGGMTATTTSTSTTTTPLENEVSQLMAENEYEIRKEERLEKERLQQQKDYWTPAGPDQNWLPIKNPKPVDDEPWFTG